MNTLFGVHHEEKALSSWDIEEPDRPTHWRHLYRASFAPLQNQRILLTILKKKKKEIIRPRTCAGGYEPFLFVYGTGTLFTCCESLKYFTFISTPSRLFSDFLSPNELREDKFIFRHFKASLTELQSF